MNVCNRMQKRYKTLTLAYYRSLILLDKNYKNYSYQDGYSLLSMIWEHEPLALKTVLDLFMGKYEDKADLKQAESFAKDFADFDPHIMNINVQFKLGFFDDRKVTKAVAKKWLKQLKNIAYVEDSAECYETLGDIYRNLSNLQKLNLLTIGEKNFNQMTKKYLEEGVFCHLKAASLDCTIAAKYTKAYLNGESPATVIAYPIAQEFFKLCNKCDFLFDDIDLVEAVLDSQDSDSIKSELAYKKLAEMADNGNVKAIEYILDIIAEGVNPIPDNFNNRISTWVNQGILAESMKCVENRAQLSEIEKFYPRDEEKTIAYYEEAISKGSIISYFYLGGFYETRQPVLEENLEKAREYYLKGYEKSGKSEMYLVPLGRVSFGLADYRVAEKYLRLAEETDVSGESNFYLALIYTTYDRDQDYEEQLTKAAELSDDPIILDNIAYFRSLRSSIIPEDLTHSYEEVKSLAKKHDSGVIEFALARLYSRLHEGSPNIHTKILNFLEKSADKFGYREACDSIYFSYIGGRVKTDPKLVERALSILESAATNGNEYAYFVLGNVYARGSASVPMDTERSIGYFKKVKDPEILKEFDKYFNSIDEGEMLVF